MLKWLKKSQAGQAMVEMALVLPILVVLVGGILDFGWLFYNKISLNNAAREGARYAVIHYTTSPEWKNDTIALMEVSLEHPKYYDSFSDMISQTRNIASCYYISGDFDFLLKIVAPSEDLEEIHRKIKSFPGVSGTRTNVVLRSLKTESTLLPEG